MEYYEITPAEKQMVEAVRTLKPFERMEIVADNMGKLDTFLITRTAKMIFSSNLVIPIK